MESEHFPSSIQEGWIRAQISLMALFASGDGVVKAKFEWLITTTSPKSMGIRNFPGYQMGLHGFGYSS
jgi:hypothetical protein